MQRLVDANNWIYSNNLLTVPVIIENIKEEIFVKQIKLPLIAHKLYLDSNVKVGQLIEIILAHAKLVHQTIEISTSNKVIFFIEDKNLDESLFN